MPVEVLVVVEGWTKVRDASGTIGWIASKSLSDKRMLEVRAPGADVRASPDDAAPVVFRADTGPAARARRARDIACGGIRPRAGSRCGIATAQTGYVRISQVFGF